MNWSIEQNYILLHFVKLYGENEWSKHVNELKDMFFAYLTNPTESDIASYNEDDFRRQYYYILVTTRQECQKQGVKVLKQTDLLEIALKKFHNYLEQQNQRDDGMLWQMDLRLLEDGRVSEVNPERLREMREKIFVLVGEDLLGHRFGFSDRLELKNLREKYQRFLKETSDSWIRTLGDGRLCVAGDTNVFSEEALNKLVEISSVLPQVAAAAEEESSSDDDSDATDTLEDTFIAVENKMKVISFNDALKEAGLGCYLQKDKQKTDNSSSFLRKSFGQQIIAGWHYTKMNDEDSSQELLDERLRAWEDESVDITSCPTEDMQLQSHTQQILPSGTPTSSVSTSTPQMVPTTAAPSDSYEATPPSVLGTDELFLEEMPTRITAKEGSCRSSRKRGRGVASYTPTSSNSSSQQRSVVNRDTDNRKKIMRNIVKMIQDHRYGSILTRPIREDTGIYKLPLLSIAAISQAVTNGQFSSYEEFIEKVILFFLQMKVYYVSDLETVKKIDLVYTDVSKQLFIIYPKLNDTLTLSCFLQRRQSRFKGHYA